MENNRSLNNDIIIEVNNVSRCFNLARERVDSLKEYVVRRIKGNLHFDEFWATASSAVNTTLPQAAPGDAPSAFATGSAAFNAPDRKSVL